MHTKSKNTHKKCENANVVPLKKGTAKTKSFVPLEKEQQKHKCRSFGKGTVKIKSAEVLFHSKRNSKTESAEVLFHSERNSKMDNHKMQTCKKTNSLFTALMLRMSYTLNEATPETQNIKKYQKRNNVLFKNNM